METRDCPHCNYEMDYDINFECFKCPFCEYEEYD